MSIDLPQLALPGRPGLARSRLCFLVSPHVVLQILDQVPSIYRRVSSPVAKRPGDEREPFGFPLISHPPGPSNPGLVILPRSSTLFSVASLTPLLRASWRMLRPVRMDSFAILAASSYPMMGVSAVASIGLRSTSSVPRSVACKPSTQRSEKLRTEAASSVIDSIVAAPATGIITFNSKKLPDCPEIVTVRSLP